MGFVDSLKKWLTDDKKNDGMLDLEGNQPLEIKPHKKTSQPINIKNIESPESGKPIIGTEYIDACDVEYFSTYVEDTSQPQVIPKGKIDSKPLKVIFPKTNIYEKRNIIVLAVENTKSVNEYNADVLRLINKLIETNKTELFMFLRYGNDQCFFELMDYNSLKEQKLPDCLLVAPECKTEQVKLSEALQHILTFVKTFDKPFKVIEYKNKKYELFNTSIIFIGSGKSDNAEADIIKTTEFLRTLHSNDNINTIKYFCIKDEDTINAALVGFPIIGHIEANFYK